MRTSIDAIEKSVEAGDYSGTIMLIIAGCKQHRGTPLEKQLLQIGQAILLLLKHKPLDEQVKAVAALLLSTAQRLKINTPCDVDAAIILAKTHLANRSTAAHAISEGTKILQQSARRQP